MLIALGCRFVIIVNYLQKMRVLVKGIDDMWTRLSALETRRSQWAATWDSAQVSDLLADLRTFGEALSAVGRSVEDLNDQAALLSASNVLVASSTRARLDEVNKRSVV